MTVTTTQTQPLVIIGGGIAGLAAAWYCQQAGIPWTLLEARNQLGGLIQTQHINDFAMEWGPDAFITRKPWAMDLVRDLGIEDQIIAVNDTPERIYVLSNGDLVPMPAGVNLLVPTDIGAFLQSPLLSWRGKLRALLDWFVPPRLDDSDESLANFVTRRMGSEMLDKLADPLLAGVYNAEMHKQSILATFPQFRTLEKEYGSLIRGMLRRKRLKPPSPRTSPALVSFKRGMGQLTEELIAQLTGDIRTGIGVESIASAEATTSSDSTSSQAYTLSLTDGSTLQVDRLIIATPANVAANLLTHIAPQASATLHEIRYAGVGNMSLAYNADDIPRPLDAYGVVIPSSEDRPIDGMQWSSSKWDDRAPAGKALIRVFFGGPHTRTMLEKDDALLLKIVRRELRDLLDIQAEPLFTTLHRWQNAYPQYDVGHLDRVEHIWAHLPHNVRLAGNAYGGVGVPDTVNSAREAVDALTAFVTVD